LLNCCLFPSHDRGVVLYVGEGKEGRHKHATSGISHVRHLNYLTFCNKPLDVEVIPVADKQTAVEQENELIESLSPLFNVGIQGKFAYVYKDIMKIYNKFCTKENYSDTAKDTFEFIIKNIIPDGTFILNRTITERRIYEHISKHKERGGARRFNLASIIKSHEKLTERVYRFTVKDEFLEDPLSFARDRGFYI